MEWLFFAGSADDPGSWFLSAIANLTQAVKIARGPRHSIEAKIMNASRFKSLLAFYLLAMVTMHAAILWRLHEPVFEGYSDFASFYTAGKLVQQGRAPSLYDPRLQWETQQQFASAVKIRKGPLPYIRPPFEALLFLPLAHFSYSTAYLIWTGIKILLLLLLPFLIPPRSTSLFRRYLAGLLCAGFFPVGLDLLHGQDALVLLFVLVLVLCLLQQKCEFWSGCCLGLGLFKFHLVLPIALIFLLRRKWRFTAGFLLTASTLGAISLALVGWSGILQYPQYVWSVAHTSGAGVTTWQSMPNLRALLSAVLPGHAVTGPVNVLLAAVMFLGSTVTAWLWDAAALEDDTQLCAGFSLAITVTLLTSYYSYGYDLALLLVPILFLGGSMITPSRSPDWPRQCFVVAFGLFLLSPLYWILILRTQQFYWVAFLPVFLFAISLAGLMRTSRNHPTTAEDPSRALPN